MWGINVMDGDVTWGGEHTVQCTDDVLWNCAPETCIILLVSVVPISSMKKKVNKNKTCWNLTLFPLHSLSRISNNNGSSFG